MILRRVARPLLAAVFIADGLRAVRHPAEEIEDLPGAKQQLEALAKQVPYLPANATLLVRGLGVTKILAGVALGLGVAPRVAASVLTALQVPTMLATHPVWAVPASERKGHLGGLLRDGAVLGGLLLAVADTEGKPSLAWRLDTARARGTKKAKKLGASTTKEIARTVDGVEAAASRTAKQAARRAEHAAQVAAKRVEAAARQVEHDVENAVESVVEGVKARAAAVTG